MDAIYPLNPLISICVPVFNSAPFIEKTLSCLCSQTYKKIEIIVVDDGSTDGSAQLIRKIRDHRIQMHSKTKGGASAARNFAYKKSKGKFVIFFDADDYVGPNFVLSQLNTIRNRDNVVVLSRWGRYYNDDINTVQPEDIPIREMEFREWIGRYWHHGNPMTNPGRVLIPRPLIEQAGLWNEHLSLNDDLEFFTRIFLKTGKIMFNGDALFHYHSGINGLSGNKGAAAYQSYYDSIFLSVNQVLSTYGQDTSILKTCANMWQLFVYSVYPESPDLVRRAEGRIRDMGGSDLSYPSGKLTGILTEIAGWKAAKRIRSIF